MARFNMAELVSTPVAVAKYQNLARLFKPQGRLVQMIINGIAANQLRLVLKLKFNPNNGTISVHSGHFYAGRITTDGVFHSVLSQCTPQWRAVTDLLFNADADPIKAAGQYGIESGKCGCCGRELTDPDSIKIGIGPICLRFFK